MRPLWPAGLDSRQGPSLIPLMRHLSDQQASQTVRRRGPLPHMPKFALGALCAHAFASRTILPGLRIFQLPRCRSRVLLRS